MRAGWVLATRKGGQVVPIAITEWSLSMDKRETLVPRSVAYARDDSVLLWVSMDEHVHVPPCFVLGSQPHRPHTAPAIHRIAAAGAEIRHAALQLFQQSCGLFLRAERMQPCQLGRDDRCRE